MSKRASRQPAANAVTYQCPAPGCGKWIPCQRGRLAWEGHIRREHPSLWERILRMRSQPDLRCPKCGEWVKGRRALSAHMRAAHPALTGELVRSL